MGMSEFYGAGDEAESIATIHRALTSGVDLLDTADIYGPFTNEQLVGAGDRRPPRRGGAGHQVRDRPRPRRTRRRAASTAARTTCSAACDASLRRLARRLHRPLLPAPGRPRRCRSRRPSARWPSWSTPARCASSGCRRPAPETIRRAHAVHPITRAADRVLAVEPRSRGGDPADVRELGIGFVAYSPLGRGFLTGADHLARGPRADDFRRHNPRFQGENFAPQPRARATRCARSRAEQECTPGAARARLGAGPGRRTSSRSPAPSAARTWRRTSRRPRSRSAPTIWRGSTRPRRSGPPRGPVRGHVAGSGAERRTAAARLRSGLAEIAAALYKTGHGSRNLEWRDQLRPGQRARQDV